ncbi:MAG: S46 family peptidase [Bacteroidales bacterium]|nr:S46 family peptidase [Bacteroidales bacterium]
MISTFKKIFILFVLVLLGFGKASGKEGMWLPVLLDQLNIEDMQANGFKLSADDIYSINQACIKDAIVLFGRGCTGEIISDEGLILTNHHCGFGRIQSHSSVGNDYLTDGFWAMSRDEELPNPGLTVTFLRKMEDVTDRILNGVSDEMEADDRRITIYQNIGELKEEVIGDSHLNADVLPLFYGNQYFLFVYEDYLDVRLVGAPPSAIGKFGYDNDNWIWPRHTGDFSLFRIYAGEDNQPVVYSPDNKPYKPKKHLPISLKGVSENDFTMVMGYPGSTFQFITSHELKIITELSVPKKFDVRTIRMDIMDEEMKKSNAVYIQYASKYSGVTNAWKKWDGMLKGLDRLNAIEVKQKREAEFNDWVAGNQDRKEKYGNLMDDFKKIYAELETLYLANDYEREIVGSIEILRMASNLDRFLTDALSMDRSSEEYENAMKEFKEDINSYFKDYYQPIDQRIFQRLIEVYQTDLEPEFHPELFTGRLKKKYKNDYKKFTDWVYKKTILTDQQSLLDLADNFNEKTAKKVQEDPAYQLRKQFDTVLGISGSEYDQLRALLSQKYRLYVEGLMEMEKETVFYPDANLTMRITYGKVEEYFPRDAVRYGYLTTLKGVIQKEATGGYDYVVPDRLKTLYREKDFGPYGVDGTMPVCFIASNHTSGGNSGSPVLNAEGQLIGLNFDRGWEGTMSDYMYDPEQCRNIAVDIRYVLFIIDKYAGAGHLIDELTLIGE